MRGNEGAKGFVKTANAGGQEIRRTRSLKNATTKNYQSAALQVRLREVGAVMSEPKGKARPRVKKLRAEKDEVQGRMRFVADKRVGKRRAWEVGRVQEEQGKRERSKV